MNKTTRTILFFPLLILGAVGISLLPIHNLAVLLLSFIYGFTISTLLRPFQSHGK